MRKTAFDAYYAKADLKTMDIEAVVAKRRRTDIRRPVLRKAGRAVAARPIDSPARPRPVSIRVSLQTILLALFALVGMAAAIILMFFNFKRAAIYGNTKYSQEQVESFITRGRLGENTFVMALKYHNRKVEGIPFIDRIDIDITSPSTIRVNIKEKPVDAYVEGPGGNIYFSVDGTVQTISGRMVEGSTLITGIEIGQAEIGKPIQIQGGIQGEDCLQLLQALDKYGARKETDAIEVGDDGNLRASFGEVQINFGKTDFDRKVQKICPILPHLEGRQGTINLSRPGRAYVDADIVLVPSAKE